MCNTSVGTATCGDDGHRYLIIARFVGRFVFRTGTGRGTPPTQTWPSASRTRCWCGSPASTSGCSRPSTACTCGTMTEGTYAFPGCAGQKRWGSSQGKSLSSMDPIYFAPFRVSCNVMGLFRSHAQCMLGHAPAPMQPWPGIHGLENGLRNGWTSGSQNALQQKVDILTHIVDEQQPVSTWSLTIPQLMLRGRNFVLHVKVIYSMMTDQKASLNMVKRLWDLVWTYDALCIPLTFFSGFLHRYWASSWHSTDLWSPSISCWRGTRKSSITWCSWSAPSCAASPW